MAILPYTALTLVNSPAIERPQYGGAAAVRAAMQMTSNNSARPCRYEEGDRPKVIRLHLVRGEIIAE